MHISKLIKLYILNMYFFVYQFYFNEAAELNIFVNINTYMKEWDTLVATSNINTIIGIGNIIIKHSSLGPLSGSVS